MEPRETIRDWYCRVLETASRGYPPGAGRDDAVLVTLVQGLPPVIKREVGRYEFTCVEEAMATIERVMVADELYRKETRPPGTRPAVSCYKCGRSGHIQRNCTERSGKSVSFVSMPMSSESLFTLNIYINGRHEKAVVDTGSTISILEECMLPKHVKTFREASKVISITGEEVHLHKTAVISFQVGNKSFEAKFRVRTGMPCRVLLGCDVLQKIGGYLCLADRTYHLEPQYETAWLGEAPETPTSLKQEVMRAYPTVFAESENDLGCCAGVEHRINLCGTPKRVLYRSVPARLRDTLRSLLDEMLHVGVIRPSHSQYSAPVLLRPKKDGSYRVCVDYRLLNDVTQADAYPTPRPAEALHRMHGAKVFSKLDLQSGYWQIPMAERDIEKTAFTTPFGLFEFTKMPFGFSVPWI